MSLQKYFFYTDTALQLHPPAEERPHVFGDIRSGQEAGGCGGRCIDEMTRMHEALGRDSVHRLRCVVGVVDTPLALTIAGAELHPPVRGEIALPR